MTEVRDHFTAFVKLLTSDLRPPTSDFQVSDFIFQVFQPSTIASDTSPATIMGMTAMTIISFIFGALLNLVGIICFFQTGDLSVALFSCVVGILLIICAVIARDPLLHRKGMQGASFVSLAGLAGNASAVMQLPLVLKKYLGAPGTIIICRNATALLCLIFLVRCLQEELQTRRAKKAEKSV